MDDDEEEEGEEEEETTTRRRQLFAGALMRHMRTRQLSSVALTAALPPVNALLPAGTAPFAAEEAARVLEALADANKVMFRAGTIHLVS